MVSEIADHGCTQHWWANRAWPALRELFEVTEEGRLYHPGVRSVRDHPVPGEDDAERAARAARNQANAVAGWAPGAASAAGDGIVGGANAVADWAPGAAGAVGDFAGDAGGAMMNAGGAVADWAPGAMDSVGDFAGDAFSAIADFF